MPFNRDALMEMIRDAETCRLLTAWEQGFMLSMKSKALMQGDKLDLTEKQVTTLTKIELKMYDVG